MPYAPVQHSSKESRHRTPKDAFDALNEEFAFTWDCFADRDSSLVGHCFYGPGSPHGTNALKVRDAQETVSVTGRRFVGFGNPPYARKQGINIAPFVRWMYLQARFHRGVVVAVVPHATQTEWWSRYVWNRAFEVRQQPHRWSFLTPEGEEQGNAGVNHCVVVWKDVRRYIGFRTTVNYWSWR